jgi:hypothetical protein
MAGTRLPALGLVLFTSLSATDYALTSAIVLSGAGHEANPVAAAWLDRHGWGGLAAFKALSVAAFAGAVAVLGRYHPRAAAVTSTSGCAVLLAVVVYSRAMLDGAARPQPPAPEEVVLHPAPGDRGPGRVAHAEDPSLTMPVP